jgi:hypothetical protein
MAKEVRISGLIVDIPRGIANATLFSMIRIFGLSTGNHMLLPFCNNALDVA